MFHVSGEMRGALFYLEPSAMAALADHPPFLVPRLHSMSNLPVEKRDRAYEVKFLLPDAMADRVLAWARLHLAIDPHADQSMGDGYRVNSLYFDTASFDVFHRRGSFRRRKYRVRRYGSESLVFLERKTKSSGVVRKRRTVVPESDLSKLTALADSHTHETEGQVAADPTWPGDWFHRKLIARRLMPRCHVGYDRVARVGMTPEGPIRLTVDRHVRCHAVAEMSVPRAVEGIRLLTEQSIVEFKFRVAMPGLFKGLIHELALTPSSMSKYRLSAAACGLVSSISEPLETGTPQSEHQSCESSQAACG